MTIDYYHLNNAYCPDCGHGHYCPSKAQPVRIDPPVVWKWPEDSSPNQSSGSATWCPTCGGIHVGTAVCPMRVTYGGYHLP